tara:strand:+ start:3609 stop:4430 length:822 start_codon:yes stop_codon:yes gene_type:complete
LGAQVNEFSTDATFSQNSNVKVPTQQAVKTYVDNLSSLSGNLTIGGNLTVNGTTTTVNSTNTTISDKLIELGSGTTGSPSGDIGIIFERGSSPNIFIGYDESEDQIAFKTTTGTGASTGDLSFTSNANVLLGNMITDRIITNEVIERVAGLSTGPTGTVALDLADKAVFNYTGNASGNFAFNVRGNNSTTLSSMLAVNECLTIAVVVQNGGTAYWNDGFDIDGVDNWSNVKWPAGVAPTQGTASGVDVYTFSIFRTGSNSTDYRIIANVTGYS